MNTPITAVIDHLEKRFSMLKKGEVTDEITTADVRRLVTVATKIFAFAHATYGSSIDAVDGSVTPTEAVILASGLLDASDLNTFDLTLWRGTGQANRLEGTV